MAYTLEKGIATAKQSILRLKSINVLAGKCEQDNQLRNKFMTSFNIAEKVNRDFQEIDKKVLVDESSDNWGEYCQLVVEIDDLFIDILNRHII